MTGERRPVTSLDCPLWLWLWMWLRVGWAVVASWILGIRAPSLRLHGSPSESKIQGRNLLVSLVCRGRVGLGGDSRRTETRRVATDGKERDGHHSITIPRSIIAIPEWNLITHIGWLGLMDTVSQLH
ncbi:unnamed protein product [Parajaminaea phylloscopi]